MSYAARTSRPSCNSCSEDRIGGKGSGFVGKVDAINQARVGPSKFCTREETARCQERHDGGDSGTTSQRCVGHNYRRGDRRSQVCIQQRCEAGERYQLVADRKRERDRDA